MQQITEQQILSLAPNPAAAANGRKISQKGGFVRLERSADDTFYLGECTGSGKNNYITTADYIVQDAPVFRCSCPSRQFPCKHSLALMYELLAQKNFAICEIPEDILKKREKKQAKATKEQSTENLSPEEAKKAEKKKEASKRASKTARTKKLKKQLEGLEMTEKLVKELMRAGLGTMGGTALDTYRQLAKQLGDYYLPGPQRLLNSLILEIAAFQKDGLEDHYEQSIDILEKLWTLVKKSRQYLTEKLEKDATELDDNLLYEELGGIYKLSELEEIGRCKKDASFVQLAFWVEYSEARKEYIDTACWADLKTGEVFMTYNYRPVKALKYVKQEDTIFGVADVAMAACYPGEGNVRIRWESAQMRPVLEEDLVQLLSHACSALASEAKAAKNILKNAMTDTNLYRLIAYEEIGNTENGPALRTENGDTILLGNAPGMEITTGRLTVLPNEELYRGQVLLGAFYYDKGERRLKLQPLSIITKTDIVRLLY